ncbi:MAG: hypothetical protein KA818_07100 [Methanoculleus sp.]|nr:hypothetical protein [Methanoculleus sp.]
MQVARAWSRGGNSPAFVRGTGRASAGPVFALTGEAFGRLPEAAAAGLLNDPKGSRTAWPGHPG